MKNFISQSNIIKKALIVSERLLELIIEGISNQKEDLRSSNYPAINNQKIVLEEGNVKWVIFSTRNK